MPVEVYLHQEFDTSHERLAFGRFLEEMVRCFEPGDRLFCIVVRPEIRSEKDLLLISSSAIAVVELKSIHVEDYERQAVRLSGGESGPWTYRLPGGLAQTLGGSHATKNPFIQVQQGRFDLAGWLLDHPKALPGGPWNKDKALERISGWVVISPGFDRDVSELDLRWDQLGFCQVDQRWFRLLAEEQLAHVFGDARHPRLRLSEDAIRSFAGHFAPRCLDVERLMPHAVLPLRVFSRAPEKPALIDRTGEREELQPAFGDSGGAIYIMQGLAGAGRTTLAAWAADEARAQGYRVRWLECSERNKMTLDAFLAGIADEVDDMSRLTIRDPARPREDRVEAALAFLSRRPTLLVFEDYHALANRSDFDWFVERASRYRECLRIMITSREQLRDTLRPHTAIREVTVGSLSYEDFATLFESLYGDRLRLSPAELRAVWEKLDGNPQALEISVPIIKQYHMMGKVSEIPVGKSEEWFAQILQSLSREARELLDRLSVVGMPFDFPIIHKLSEKTDIEASRMAAELENNYLLRSQSAAGTYTVAGLIRAAVRSQMAPEAALSAHRRAAECFMELADGTCNVGERAGFLLEAIRQYDKIGSRKQLLRRAADAYELLVKLGDWDRASALAEVALAHASSGVADPETACTWHMQLADLALLRDMQSGAEAHVAAAEQMAKQMPQKLVAEQKARWQKLGVRILLLRGVVAYFRPNYAASADCFMQALQSTGGDRATEAACLAGLGRIRRHERKYAEAREYYEQVVRLAGESGDQRLRGEGLSHLGLIARSQGDLAAARACFEEALEIAKVNDPFATEIYMGHLGRTEMIAGNYTEAERIFRECLRRARELHTSRGERYHLVNLTEALIRQRRLDEAEEVLTECEAHNLAAGDKIGTAFDLKHRGEILKARGEFERGQQFIANGIGLLQEAGDQEYLPEFQAAFDNLVQLPLTFE